MPMLPPMPRPWSPTHFISFTPLNGQTETWVVMMSATPDAKGVRPAHTRDEWLKSAPSSWRCTVSGTWTCDGRPTPKGRLGTVAVKETSGGYKKMEWAATHRITFFPTGGQPTWWMVMARPDPYRSGHWAAMTRDEWFAQCPTEWCCSPEGVWSWKGLPTPKDAPGVVHVEDASGGFPIQPAPDEDRHEDRR
jgi:hypothetical protein